MKRIIAILLALITVFALIGCNNEKTPEVTTSNSETEDGNSVKFSDYKLIYSARISKNLETAITEFRKSIKDYTDILMDFDYDLLKEGETAEGRKEILIGKTNRAETEEAASILENADANSFIIKNSGDKIVIFGNNDTDLLFGMNSFIKNFVKTSNGGVIDMEPDFQIIGGDDGETTILPNLVTVTTEMISTVESNYNRWSTYGRLLQLKHNGENNGVLFATSQWAANSFPLYRSDDDGKTWTFVTEIKEQITPALSGNWQPELYELPVDVGVMPEGTLLLGGCTHGGNITRMCLWRSFDLGQTWEEFTVVDHGHGGSDGMWEPFMICDEDGSLVVFYSDETDVSEYGGQRLVYRVSKNGEDWGEKQYCVAPENKSLRPGMVSVAKMGDEGYLIVYEMIGLSGGPVYYKTSDSLTNWDYESLGTRIIGKDGEVTGWTPYCVWTPAGGIHGTVVACGRSGDTGYQTQSKIFLSNDLGKTWRAIDNPLVWDYPVETGYNPNYSYSLGFMVGSDGALYHIANCFPENEKDNYKYTQLRMCKIIID